MQGGYRLYTQRVAIRGEPMNFPKLERNKVKKITASDFSACDEAENIAFSPDGISLRPALCLSGQIVHESNMTKANEFKLTSAVVFSGGKYNRLTAHYNALGSYSYKYSFSLVSVMGEVTKAGSIEYSVGSDGVIRIPQSINCFSANAVKGIGIFAFIALDTSNEEYSQFEVYELSTDLKSWLKIKEKEMYIPTYYINGRGNLYNLFEDDLEKPEYVESLNLLNGICNCYFTTDGFSNCFYLPIKSAIHKDAHITAELTADTDTTLHFTFPKNTFVSNSVEYNGVTVSLAYNGGFLQIIGSSGYLPQRIYNKDNNLKVTIKHETEQQYDYKAKMTKANFYQLCPEGSQAVLSANSKYASLTLVSHPNNPLYFPESLSIKAGNDSAAVVATATIKNKLLIFKEDGIYKADVKKDSFTLKQICSSVGVKWGSTVAESENYVIFMGADNRVYAVMPDDTVKDISGRIYNITSTIFYPNTVFSVLSRGRYIIYIDNVAFALDIKMSDKALDCPVWSVWHYPVNIEFVDGFSVGEDIGYLCKTSINSYYKYYPVMSVNSSEDYYFISRSSVLERVKTPITLRLKTTVSAKDNRYTPKMFRKATLICSSTQGCDVTFINDNGAISKTFGINFSYEENGQKSVRLYPLLRSRECRVEILATGLFNLSAMTLEYYELTE